MPEIKISIPRLMCKARAMMATLTAGSSTRRWSSSNCRITAWTHKRRCPLFPKTRTFMPRSRVRSGPKGAAQLRYSLITLSAHSTKATRSGGVTNLEFFPARSVSRTARAREHAVQTFIGILCSMVLRKISVSGGHPTGVTDCINSSFIRLTASPSRKILTSCPASAKAFAWRNAKLALVDSSDPHGLLINTFMLDLHKPFEA